MSVERKCFETKIIAGHSYSDYWDLNTHPLYILLDKKDKPCYLRFEEEPFEASTRIGSLTEIRNELYKNEWAFQGKYWKALQIQIQTMINIPWTAR
jgi:hypothetical protein